jgi:serine protease Do
MKTKNAILIILLAMGSSIFTIATYNYFTKENRSVVFGASPTNVKFTGYTGSPESQMPGTSTDFTAAASLTTPTVVHIKTSYAPKQTQRGNYDNDPFKDFFGNDFFNFRMDPYNQQPQESSGSGVIISDDGYIVTNNHVIEDGDVIKVIMFNQKEYTATLIGTDPSTDLALLKIDAGTLPFIAFGNSDSTKVGEWVLAVGNPFNLESTVTAGIVSAKGRNINILKQKGSIESFIQTDAAVNPGNSGGALVNLRGELIGINSAIATPTGSFAGYSFAVPVNIVKKIVNDLVKFGMVQRGYLGVNIANISADLAKEKELKITDGIYVDGVNEGSAAADAGLKEGDVITQINGVNVLSTSELQEQIAKYHPGDDITVTAMRGDKEKTFNARLKNVEGETSYMKKDQVSNFSSLGADFTDLSSKELSDLKISGGVKVMKIYDGKLSKNTDIKEGFVITRIDNKPVNNLQELKNAIKGKEGLGIIIEGKYPNYNGSYMYSFRM